MNPAVLDASEAFFVSCVLSEEEKNQNESKNCLERDVNTDPWPGYRYTGKLRPHYPLVRRKSLYASDSIKVHR